MDSLKVDYTKANEMLRHYGSVRRAIEAGHNL
jgi:hypothetical protein